MIGIHHISTQSYFCAIDRYYSMLELAIGSVATITIDDAKVRLKVLNSPSGTCDGCYFKEKELCPKNGHNAVGVACCPEERLDGNHCIFKEVKDKKQNKKQN